MRELLPVHYFPVVFTVPACLQPLFVMDRRRSYALLFAAVWETVSQVCRRRLVATPGMIAVLHTWSQTLVFHPHVHASAPTRRDQGEATLRKAASQPWVVYSKPPMAGAQQVLRYLGRYTHRIAISNTRIVSIADGHVRFRYRDRRRENKVCVLTVTGQEFTRRFLQHALPKRFVRLRHYGLFANAHRSARLATARAALGAPITAQPANAPPESWRELYLRLTGREPDRCSAPPAHPGQA